MRLNRTGTLLPLQHRVPGKLKTAKVGMEYFNLIKGKLGGNNSFSWGGAKR